MITISKTASTNTILAIELGEYKNVVCAQEPASRQTGDLASRQASAAGANISEK